MTKKYKQKLKKAREKVKKYCKNNNLNNELKNFKADEYFTDHLPFVSIGDFDIVSSYEKEAPDCPTENHKQTQGKLKLNLIPPEAQVSIAKVREFGANKYKDAWAWKKVVKPEDLVEAAKRHLLKIDLGEYIDSESGFLHIEHALTSLAMAIQIIKERGQNGD